MCDGNLNARLRQTLTGATVWSNGAHGKWKLAGLNLVSGQSVLDRYE